MDLILVTVIVVSLIVIVGILLLLRWLKINYPQAYENDHVMAGLGGFSALSVTLANKLPIAEPFHVVAGMLPVLVVACIFSTSSKVQRIKYISLVVTTVVAASSITYWVGVGNWFLYGIVAIVFLWLWVILFRWRYVLGQNN